MQCGPCRFEKDFSLFPVLVLIRKLNNTQLFVVFILLKSCVRFFWSLYVTRHLSGGTSCLVQL